VDSEDPAHYYSDETLAITGLMVINNAALCCGLEAPIRKALCEQAPPKHPQCDHSRSRVRAQRGVCGAAADGRR
jgi:hypothetical protein